MSRIILCDIPNTLFDSRHRTSEEGLFSVGLQYDEINYVAYTLLKKFEKLNYHIVLTHYVLTRLKSKIVNKLAECGLTNYELITNRMNQDVYDNKTLKKYIFEHTGDNIAFVIDNDKDMEAYWLQNQVGLIKVPLPMKLPENSEDTLNVI